LGASAQGSSTGPEGSDLALEGAAGAGFFDDLLTVNSPLVVAGGPGFVRYGFTFEGSLSTPGTPTPFEPETARAELGFFQNGVGINRVVEVDSTVGSAGAITSLDGNTAGFVSGAGSISGSGFFTSLQHGEFGDIDQPINFGQPFELKVGLIAWVIGSGDADFSTTAALTDVEFFDANGSPVSDFTLTSASGTSYGSASPEPSALLPACSGLFAIWKIRRSKVFGSRGYSSIQ
jgi:hypothetical protein